MKKLAVTGLIVLYLVPFIGVTKSTHYCMGKELSVKYFSFQSERCMCETVALSSCCSDVLEVFKIEEDQKQSRFDFGDKQLLIIAPVFQSLEFTTLVNDNEDDQFSAFELPPPRSVPIFILTSSFQYYG